MQAHPGTVDAVDARIQPRSPDENVDPRIRRSRRMLQDALASLMTTRDFEKISIGDIAEAATLNRATFYDHYPDKFALLECLIGTRFGELMALRGVRVSECSGALRALALGVCDYLAETQARGGKVQTASFQGAIVGVIRTMLMEGLREQRYAGAVPAEVVASTVAWAIFGAADAWVKRDARCPAEEMAEVIDRLVQPMLGAAMDAPVPVGFTTAQGPR